MSEPDLVERLEIKAAMIEMGEKIAWGSDSALMREAAAELSTLRSRCETLEREVARCHERLEIDHHFVMVGDDQLERRGVPLAERADEVDGIEARDCTIALQDKQIEALRAARDEAVRALERAAERYTVFRQLLIDTMDTSPPTEGAQEFINRLTDAMEAAADKFELPNSNGGGS